MPEFLFNRVAIHPKICRNCTLQKVYMAEREEEFLSGPSSKSCTGWQFSLISISYFVIVQFLVRWSNESSALRKKCPNTEFFLVRIFPHSDWLRIDAEYLSVFIPNAGKYRPEKLHIWTLFMQWWCFFFWLIVVNCKGEINKYKKAFLQKNLLVFRKENFIHFE